ncbi:hypothetical protein ACJMK2_012414 [Sinanodonta woodiana]|uniref:Uncharacterized protein n=1 Tax=Sinanodonta woodiana TaxID=1069815 RepID=A0ABD3V844_SINWO
MDQDMEMTFGDSEFCTFYEFPSKAFPGFRYIQYNLISFYPRFQRTVENLPICLKWKELLEDLSRNVGPLEQSKPEVILFGEKHSMVKTEQIVTDINQLGSNELKRDTFSRKNLHAHVSADKPQVIIYRCSSDQVQQEITHLKEELPETGLNNILLLIDVGGQSEQEGRAFMEEMIVTLSDTSWRDKMIINTPGHDLITRISSHLEMCMLKICKRIYDCIGELLSVQRKVGSTSIIKSNLVSVVSKFFRSKIVVQDLMNLAYQRQGKDQFLKEQIILLIQRVVSEEFHAQFKMAAGDIHAMLKEMKFKKECKKQISPSTWLGIKSQLSSVYVESQRSEESMETETETGKRSPQNRRSRYRKKIRPSILRAKMLLKDLQPVLKEVKRFLWGVQEALKTLSQLQFELEDILESYIPQTKKLKNDVPDQTKRWTDKLLLMDEVQGCGDYFGNLIVFILNQNSIAKEQEVKQKIAMCLSGCPYDYDIKFTSKPRTFANLTQSGSGSQIPHSILRAGDKIRWVDKLGTVSHGTLGIFILGKEEQSVYFVTNKHVVNGEGKCYICVTDDSYDEIGTVKWESWDGYIDIAAVEVNSNMCGNCIFDYENYYGERRSYVIMKTSEDTLDSLVRKKIFKRGAETGLTVGIISSKSIQMKEEGMIKTYNTLLSPLPGSKPEEAEIFKEGDSGSVVSLFQADDKITVVMSMIIGAFEVKQTQEEREQSEENQKVEKLIIAFFLMDGLDNLNRTHGLDLKIET